MVFYGMRVKIRNLEFAYSRTLRQFNQDQKKGKSIANLKLNTRGHLYLKRSVLIMNTNRAPIWKRFATFIFFIL